MKRCKINILATLLSVAALALLPACSDSEPAGEKPSAGRRGAVSFRLATAELTPAARSLAYDRLETAVAQGTLIGCVIAYVNPDGTYQYAANSAWTYYPDGLMLTRLYDADNNPVDVDDPDQNTILRHTESLTYSEYDLELLPGKDYAFFFYYPYTDEETIKEQYDKFEVFENWKHTVSLAKIYFPNTGEEYPSDDWRKTAYLDMKDDDYAISDELYNAYVFGSIMGSTDVPTPTGYSGELRHASWLKYPVTPIVDFRTDDADDLGKLNASDFMYAAVTKWDGEPINKENTHSIIPVTLKKQMTTIELAFAENPSEVYLQPKANTSNWNYMPRWRDFNLATGRFVGDYSSQATREQVQSTDPTLKNLLDKAYAYKENQKIYPKYLGTSHEWVGSGETDFYVYRLIMAPQDALYCDIVMTIAGKQLTLSDLQRNPKLASLKGGTYYKIRVSKTGDDTGWHLDIEDWQDGGGSILNRP